MKTVLFALNSSYIHTNLAIRCLKTALQNAGAETCIIERNLKDKRDSVLFDLYAENADLYGFSAYIWNINELYRYASALKILRPDCKIVFGGPEISFETNDFFIGHPYIDYIIRGEGEGALVDLLKHGASGRIIDGGIYKKFTDTGISYETAPGGSIVYYESSRGCPFSCTFCLSSVTDGVRAKSAEKTLSDLREFEKLQGSIKIVKFVDRTFNFDRERAKKIWRALTGNEFRLKYHFEICAELLDEETIGLLSEFPKDKIQLEIGVQSTNRESLKACRRNTDTSIILENTRRLFEKGNIHIHCDLIAGLPYETYSRFAVSFDEVQPVCHMLQLGFLKLLPGSQLRKDAGKYGILFNPEPPYTVLCSRDISYEELHRLGRIAEAADRYSSRGFENTMKFIMKSIDSPFKFYEGIVSALPDDFSSASQNKLRVLLYDYAGKILDSVLLSAYMRFDYLLHETGRYPSYLRAGPDDGHITEKAKKEFIAESKLNGLSVHIASLEAHIFEFEPDKIYLIDRMAGIYYIRSIR